MVTFNPSEYERWDAKTQAEVADALERRMSNPPQVWYCMRGRGCDGLPHDNIPYNHARTDQWPPGTRNWFIWLMRSGRGGGKTRSATEWARKMSERIPRMGAIGRRIPDIRNTMVEGESGLIRICEYARMDYDWKPSTRTFTFANGSKMFFYTAEEPDALRGPEHGLLWFDEPAHMPLIQEVWDNALMGLRLGKDPKVLCTTTPVPTAWMKGLLLRDDVVDVRVSTYANLDNLAPSYRRTVIDRYEGTRLGRQELHGEVIEDVEGALWNGEMMDLARDVPESTADDLLANPGRFERIIVGVDPAGTANKRSDETGIVVVGRMGDDFYVLDDLTGKYSPDQWAKKVALAYDKWQANMVVAEKNYGGDMVKANLRNQDEYMHIKMVTSRRGKDIRAEPIVGLYEQGRFKHLGSLSALETEQLEWVPGVTASPNRVDALVHAALELSGRSVEARVSSPRKMSSPTSAITVPRARYSPRAGRVYRP